MSILWQPPTPDQITAWLPVLNTAGVIVILVVIVMAIVRGFLWPKHMVERALEEKQKGSEAAAKIVGTEIREGIEQGVGRAVSQGLAQGYLKILKINTGTKTKPHARSAKRR